MKGGPILYLSFLAVVFGLFYFPSRFISDHITLNELSTLPDGELLNVIYYLERNEVSRSAIHLEAAIDIITLIKQDVDLATSHKLDKTTDDLKVLAANIRAHSATREQIDDAIAQTLNTLAFAQLRIFETYAEVNRFDEAFLALTYAHTHMENLLDFSDSITHENTNLMIQKLNNVITNETLSNVEIITEVDEIVKMLE
jgi:G3E family GTPase